MVRTPAVPHIADHWRVSTHIASYVSAEASNTKLDIAQVKPFIYSGTGTSIDPM